MSKTGLKTFVFSFAFTLSAVLGVDRAVFRAPELSKEELKIPRKNIALFFSKPYPVTTSSIEPVHKTELKTLKVEPEELKIAKNIPTLPENMIIKDDLFAPEDENIPLLVEKISPEEKAPIISITKEDEEELSDVPLLYAGVEKEVTPLNNAQKIVGETVVPEKEDIKVAMSETVIDMEKISQPVVIKGTRQIIKIDNQKKKAAKEQLKPKEAVSEKQIDVANAKEKEEIPLFMKHREENIIEQEKVEKPQNNQIASLEGDVSLAEAEEMIVKEEKKEKKWQTMSEKHQDENPWLVARGSKFVKNKQVLKEKFASETSQILALEKNKISDKSAKVAVQDNLLIPIPQELLDEDNLVPDLGNNKEKETIVKKEEKVEKKEKNKSFLDNITSVFSKENREKAIKNLKAKGNKLLSKQEEIKAPILPTEIRLSFQPNRAEISGPTLRWIQAFAKKVVEDESVGLEIRIDGSRSFELQQKRLNLLYNILTANQVPYQKINTLFVEREPNSFVVRTVKILKADQQQKEDDNWKKYYQKW